MASERPSASAASWLRSWTSQAASGRHRCASACLGIKYHHQQNVFSKKHEAGHPCVDSLPNLSLMDTHCHASVICRVVALRTGCVQGVMVDKILRERSDDIVDVNRAVGKMEATKRAERHEQKKAEYAARLADGGGSEQRGRKGRKGSQGRGGGKASSRKGGAPAAAGSKRGGGGGGRGRKSPGRGKR